MNRKIIQLVQWGNQLVALCDDGSVWMKSGYSLTKWTKLPIAFEDLEEQK